MIPNKYKTDLDFKVALEQRVKNYCDNTRFNIQDIRKKIAFDRFLARLFVAPESPWILKGGYSLELLFGDSRSTKDIDLAFKSLNLRRNAEAPFDLLLAALEQACVGITDDFF